MLGVWVIAPVSALAASPSTGVPKVVLIVGPSGAATDRYRSEARAAASVARRYTLDVTEIYFLKPAGDHLDIQWWTPDGGYRQVDRY